jgi:hypothetical protein
MSRSVIIATIVAVVLSILVLSIPKNELPTKAQWESHMEYVNSPEFQNQFR